MDRIMGEIVGIATAIVGLAVVAVLVSQNAQTPKVIKAAGDALSADLKAAVSPVVGGGFSL